jgi:hypothetical protein
MVACRVGPFFPNGKWCLYKQTTHFPTETARQTNQTTTKREKGEIKI